MKSLFFILVLFFGLASYVAISQKMMPSMYTKEDILNDLEDLHPFKDLINLEHAYVHTAGSRITLFADSTRWAIVFEKAGYGEGGELELNYFGNCLINQEKQGLHGQYLSNSAYFSLITSKELASLDDDFDLKSSGLVSKNAKWVKVRNTYLPIEQDVKKYKQKRISIRDYYNPKRLIDFPSLVRYLDEQHPELFRATDDELRSLLPKDLPKLFVINQWHHKPYYVFNDGVHKPYGHKPRSYETYHLIAEVLVSKDTTKWKPTLKPNNDWRNWPAAGSL